MDDNRVFKLIGRKKKVLKQIQRTEQNYKKKSNTEKKIVQDEMFRNETCMESNYE